MRVIGADTETFLFGEQADGSFVIIPQMICTSWATRGESNIETFLVSDGDGDEMRALWEGWLKNQDLLVFQNAAFDLSVCCATWPELEPMVWEKIQRSQVTCTKIREKLLNLSSHGNLSHAELPDGSKVMLGYSLADLALNYLGLDLSADKEEGSVRTQYELYSGTPSKHYPADARSYALKDAHIPLAIYEMQQARVRSVSGNSSLSTEYFQTAVDFALRMMSAQGMRVDKERFLQLQQQMAEFLHEDNLAPAIRAGIVRPAQPARPHSRQIKVAEALLREELGVEGDIDWSLLSPETRVVMEDRGIKFVAEKPGSVNRKALCSRVEDVCKAIGTQPKLTDSGGICADAEVLQDLAAFDSHLPLEPGDSTLPEDHPRRMTPLENFQYRQSVAKIISTELPRMTWGDPPEVAERVHFEFNVLVSTGRTSSFASKHWPSGNGQQIDPRGRPCYLPEEGHWLLSTDYSALELCSVAQTTYELFGQSRHRDLINGGMDLHGYLGSTLAARLPSEFEGDLGDPMANYRMFMALKATDPEFFGHWRKFAKPTGLGFPGGLGPVTQMQIAKKTYGVDIVKAAMAMDVGDLPGPENSTVVFHARKLGITPDNWEWTPFIRGVALSTLLKQIWLDAYPEMVAYFEWVTQQRDEHNLIMGRDGQRESALCYTTPMGMHVAGGTYTSVANGRAMQAPSAEGAKAAVFRIMEACRVGQLKGRAFFHDFVHDEVILSVPADPAGATEVVEIVEDIMVDAMQNVMPDVKISVESALSERWLKQASPVRSVSTGLLHPWREGEKYSRDDEGNLWVD